ncbi:tyrosine recombinase XerC [Immundisolibacter sp.]|uniref:tyrosine recombinase XerC n=1 Tax=Immundisolibacter sp. TaxID=1934948 RepID=UPI0035630C0A
MSAAAPTVDAFLAALAHQRRASPHTLSAYRRDLERCTRLLPLLGAGTLVELTPAQIRRLVSHLARDGLSGRSIARLLAALRAYYRLAIDHGALASDPAAGITAPKSPRRLPATLDVDHLARLLDFAAEDPLARRDRAMFEVLYSSGLRLAELVALDCGDVDLADASARVTGKGRKTRIVPVGARACAALADWLVLRRTLTAEPAALFVNRRGGRLSARAVQQRLRHWADRQGIDRRVYPHLLRHSCAGHLLESSGDLRAVQELLGHASIATTQVYTQVDFQYLARVYDAAHPRARRRSG